MDQATSEPAVRTDAGAVLASETCLSRGRLIRAASFLFWGVCKQPRCIKGEKPAPVAQSTKVELMLNLKTAKTFGIAVPLPLLGRADKVIE